MKYRRHAETVEAFRWQPDMLLADMPAWAFTAVVTRRLRRQDDGSLTVMTHWGVQRADPGDWVLRDADDRLRTLTGWMFETQFEPLEPA